jgi:hypothetical protein
MCRPEIKNELVPNQYGYSFVVPCHEPQFSFLVRLELLVLSNTGALGDPEAGTTNTHCDMSCDPTDKQKITASTGKRNDRHVVSNLNSMLVKLADSACHPLTYHWLRDRGQLLNRESSNRE